MSLRVFWGSFFHIRFPEILRRKSRVLTRDYWRFFKGGYRYFLRIFYMSLRVISGSFFTCDIRSFYAANHACLRVIISVFFTRGYRYFPHIFYMSLCVDYGSFFPHVTSGDFTPQTMHVYT